MSQSPADWNNRGVQLAMKQQLQEALDCFNKALLLSPLYVEALNNRGLLLHSIRRYDEALADFTLALTFTRNDHELYNSLSATLHHLWRLDEALAAVDRSISIKPTHFMAHVSRANILQSLKRYDECIASYDEALRINPDCHVATANKVFTMDLMPDKGFAEHQAVRREWYERHGASIKRVTSYRNHPARNRKLTIGYISADFRDHSASYGIRPVLCNHDHSKFNVICYMNATVEDEISMEFRRYADKWVRCNLMNEDDLVKQIRHDKVDILVDLAGHTTDQRLGVFVRKPAPIQVTAWGYATGNGIPAIDYLFSDPTLIPPEVRHLYAEEIIDLPVAFCYGPRTDLPDVGPMPFDANGYITFGNYNRESKTSPEAIAVWARILREVPNSRMIFKENAFKHPGRRAPVLKAFMDNGVGPDRIIFRLKDMYREHMESFDFMDIALDPFPHNGGVSTWEPIWMGVPVVCKIGNSHPSRISAAVLTALDMPDCIAKTDDEYVEIAKRIANSPNATRTIRQTMRDRLRKSPAGNPALYTAEVEKAYRAMWHRWCQNKGTKHDATNATAGNDRTPSDHRGAKAASSAWGHDRAGDGAANRA